MRNRRPSVVGPGRYESDSILYCTCCGIVYIHVVINLGGVWSKQHLFNIIQDEVSKAHKHDRSLRTMVLDINPMSVEDN